jgi:phosphoribosylanthranilate isomerase
MMVKICGITNLDDALAAVDCGATALGFNFYFESPRYIAPDKAASIVSSLANVLRVGVFVNEPIQRIHAIVEQVGLDVVQLHGDEQPEILARLNTPAWKAFRVTRNWQTSDLAAWVTDTVLLDSPSIGIYGGSGEAFNWSSIGNIRKKIVLAGGLDASNVSEAIRQVKPWGVDSCSRLETGPGRKDHHKMRQFVAAALGTL